MPQVSKRGLHHNQWQQIWSIFVRCVAKVNTSKSKILLFSLLTETEQIMLAKRLLVGILLIQKYPPLEISKLLKMSRATVYKCSALLKINPEYKQLILSEFSGFKLKTKKSTQTVQVDSLVEAILKGRRERYRLFRRRV